MKQVRVPEGAKGGDEITVTIKSSDIRRPLSPAPAACPSHTHTSGPYKLEEACPLEVLEVCVSRACFLHVGQTDI